MVGGHKSPLKWCPPQVPLSKIHTQRQLLPILPGAAHGIPCRRWAVQRLHGERGPRLRGAGRARGPRAEGEGAGSPVAAALFGRDERRGSGDGQWMSDRLQRALNGIRFVNGTESPSF